MFIDRDTLASLRILQPEMHPNSPAWVSKSNSSYSKESLSVYGLFHFLAGTPQGRSHLRQLFLRPSIDLDVIMERQRTIALLLHPSNTENLKAISSILRKISNARTTLSQLSRGVNSLSHVRSFQGGI